MSALTHTKQHPPTSIDVFDGDWTTEECLRAIHGYEGLVTENAVKSAVINQLAKQNETMSQALKRFMDFDGCYAGGERMDSIDFAFNLKNLREQGAAALAVWS